MNDTPFRYAGSKSKLLPILSQYLDSVLIDQNKFADLFIGGGSVGLYVAKKYPNISLIFNDKDDWISSFWSVVSGDFNKLKDLLLLLEQPVTIQHFNNLNEKPATNDIEKAYRALFFNRTCFSGIVKKNKKNIVTSSPIGGKEQKSKYTVDCRYNFFKIKKKLIDINNLLAGRTEVFNKDIIEYLNSSPSMPMYLDPPYVKKGKELYSEYMTLEEHSKMSEILQNKSKWILSYDDCPEIRTFYNKNKIIDLSVRYCINGKKDSWENKNEIIILP